MGRIIKTMISNGLVKSKGALLPGFGVPVGDCKLNK